MYSILCSEALLQRCLFFFFFFFFLQPVAGLTNWVPVQDSQAGAPLATVSKNCFSLYMSQNPSRVVQCHDRRSLFNLSLMSAIVVVLVPVGCRWVPHWYCEGGSGHMCILIVINVSSSK